MTLPGLLVPINLCNIERSLAHKPRPYKHHFTMISMCIISNIRRSSITNETIPMKLKFRHFGEILVTDRTGSAFLLILSGALTK